MTNDKKQETTIPAAGVILWPVGSGDAVTIRVAEDVFMQVDICHRATAEDESTDFAEVIDRLKEILPKRGGKPYLAVFALTHPDQDHCLGFTRLLDEVTIGEIWHTPRVFREWQGDLCEDAKAFRTEAKRRVKKTIRNGGEVASGDRVRIIGYDDLLKEEDYEGFPKDRLTIPGHTVIELDGAEMEAVFRAFIHAPFKDDSTGDRNETSLAMQIRLRAGDDTGTLLLFGDLSYPTLRRIWDTSDADDVAWELLLAPHHCSKSAMYWRAEGEDEETLKQDILDSMEQSAVNPGIVVASSAAVPSRNKEGDNPPHAIAKERYQEIAPGGFVCTADKAPEPTVFSVGDSGFEKTTVARSGGKVGLGSAIAAARGAGQPPRDRVGFGRE